VEGGGVEGGGGTGDGGVDGQARGDGVGAWL
jgi:hypothetical protein